MKNIVLILGGAALMLAAFACRVRLEETRLLASSGNLSDFRIVCGEPNRGIEQAVRSLKRSLSYRVNRNAGWVSAPEIAVLPSEGGIACVTVADRND